MLKVGDKVRIKEDLPGHDGNVMVTFDMSMQEGKLATIEYVFPAEDSYDRVVRYRIDLDGGSWCWTENMFTSRDPAEFYNDLLVRGD